MRAVMRRSDTSVAAILARLGTLTDELMTLGIRTHCCRYRKMSDRFEFEVRSSSRHVPPAFLRRRLQDLLPGVFIYTVLPTFPVARAECGARAVFSVQDVNEAPPAPRLDGGPRAVVGGQRG